MIDRDRSYIDRYSQVDIEIDKQIIRLANKYIGRMTMTNQENQ